jgi:hypothetical protein
MKQFLSVLVALVFALTCFGTVMAAEKAERNVPAEPPAVAAPQAVSPAGDNTMKKAKPKTVTGTVKAVDAAAGTISVKGKIKTINLKADEKVMLGDFKVGDKVTVTYSGDVASKVVAAKKSPKKKAEEPAKK